MKKWIVVVAVLVALGYMDAFPFEHADAGELCVVETLLVEADSAGLTLYSAHGVGRGETMEAAVKSLEERVPGQLFLRQVKRVILCRGAEKRIDPLEMPEAIPLGAHIYMYNNSAQQLMECMEEEEKRLSAKEQREKVLPTLAELQNEVLTKHD